MRRVVAAVDLTAIGRRVAERARLVAEDSGATIELVHVAEPVGEAFISAGFSKLLRQHRESEIEVLQKWLQGRTDAEVTATVVKGSAAFEVARAALYGDLILVGTSSVHADQVGPVAKRIARKARRDVLVVKRQPRNHYRKVVAAVDLSELSRAAVELALKLAPEADIAAVFSLPVRFDGLLHDAGMFDEEVAANRKTRLALAQAALENFVSKWEGRVKPVAVDGPPVETVEEAVRRRTADLVTVASRGHGSTKMVLLGTVAEGLVDVAPCDVAVARVSGQFRRP